LPNNPPSVPTSFNHNNGAMHTTNDYVSTSENLCILHGCFFL
jgi:hypothetical protein